MLIKLGPLTIATGKDARRTKRPILPHQSAPGARGRIRKPDGPAAGAWHGYRSDAKAHFEEASWKTDGPKRFVNEL